MDPFFAEDLIEVSLGGETFLPRTLTDAEDDLFPVIQFNVWMVGGEVGHIGFGTVIVQDVVHPAMEEISGVIYAGHGQHSGKKVRAAQERICRVVCAHAAAGAERKQTGRALASDEGNSFFHDVLEIAFLSRCAPYGIRISGGPAFSIHRVYAEQLYDPVLQFILKNVAHAEVCEIVTHGILTGKDQERYACMPVDGDMHFFFQSGTEPADFFKIHVDLPNKTVFFVIYDIIIAVIPLQVISSGKHKEEGFEKQK